METLTHDRTAVDERMLEEVDRIVHSETLRSSEVLRQLLKYLGQRSATGNVDDLKEYTIAVDALGKPSSYDPRHDAAVRTQVGRLRQKLGEYYRTEGKDDASVVDLPKGKFRLTCEPRLPETRLTNETAASPIDRHKNWIIVSLAAALVIAIAWQIYSIVRVRRLQATSPSAVWTSDLRELWTPFLSTDRPLMLAVEDPMFVEFQNGAGIYYRDRGINDWTALLNAPGVIGLRKSLNNPTMQPSHYYTALGEVTSSLMLGKLFGASDKNITLVRTSELSWQEVADNNVLFVGMQVFFDPQLHGMPVRPQLIPGPAGIQNLQPANGEPVTFSDKYDTAPTEAGEVYALATHLPGPEGKGDIESFTSNRAAGYVAAVQWFTDPRLAAVVVSKLRKPSGQMPRYYQILLKVKFTDQVPTQTSYVLGRELQ